MMDNNSLSVGDLLTDAILLDVTSFDRAPLRTGIERVIQALATVAYEYPLVPFRVASSKRIEILSPDYFELVRNFYKASALEFDQLRRRYHPNREPIEPAALMLKLQPTVVGVAEGDFAASRCCAILTWTYVFDPHSLDFYFDRLNDARDKLAFLVPDFLFWTQFEKFQSAASEELGHIRYLMLLRRLCRIAFPSQFVRNEFTRRIARLWRGESIIVSPGADALGNRSVRSPSRSREFVVVGTIEPRKQSCLILRAALEMAKADPRVKVHFLGRLSPLLSADDRARFRQYSESTGPVKLTENPCDATVKEALSRARALICLSTGEGYSVTPTEALSLGVPAITSANLPCREVIGDAGQIVVPYDDYDALIAAMKGICDDRIASQKIAEIQCIKLPTWDEFAKTLLNWTVQPSKADCKSVEYFRRDYIRVCFGDDVASSVSSVATKAKNLVGDFALAQQILTRIVGDGMPKKCSAGLSVYGARTERINMYLCPMAVGAQNSARMAVHSDLLKLDACTYLNRLGEYYLGRNLTDSEIGSWLSPKLQLEHPIQIIEAFATCEEARKRLDDPYRDSWIQFVRSWSIYEVVLEGTDEPLDENFLMRCYRELLGRAPDHAGWQAHMRVRSSRRNTVASFVLSDEHLCRIQNLEAFQWALESLGFRVCDFGLGRLHYAQIATVDRTIDLRDIT